VIRRLDPLNPQVAARMAGSFETWRRYDHNRQTLMRTQLETILALPNLSTNLFEVTTKLLG
jgi:aminopeptidase N